MKGRYAKRVHEGRCPKCGRDDGHTTFTPGKVTCDSCLAYNKRWVSQNAGVIKARRTTVSRTCTLCDKPGGVVSLGNIDDPEWSSVWGIDACITVHHKCLYLFLKAMY